MQIFKAVNLLGQEYVRQVIAISKSNFELETRLRLKIEEIETKNN